ncbi:MAG: phosphopantetheine-binding protein [Steroidobacteraceae bacterium]
MDERRIDSASQPTTRERLIGLVRRILGPSAASRPIPIDVRLSDLGMSSLKMVNLMLTIESEFDIVIPQSEITPEHFESIASVEALLAKLPPSADGAL